MPEPEINTLADLTDEIHRLNGEAGNRNLNNAELSLHFDVFDTVYNYCLVYDHESTWDFTLHKGVGSGGEEVRHEMFHIGQSEEQAIEWTLRIVGEELSNIATNWSPMDSELRTAQIHDFHGGDTLQDYMDFMQVENEEAFDGAVAEGTTHTFTFDLFGTPLTYYSELRDSRANRNDGSPNWEFRVYPGRNVDPGVTEFIQRDRWSLHPSDGSQNDRYSIRTLMKLLENINRGFRAARLDTVPAPYHIYGVEQIVEMAHEQSTLPT